MPYRNPTVLPVAVRVYPEPESAGQSARSSKEWRVPNAMFVFDTETRIDAAQGLTFGSYRFIVEGQCLEEGIFYADDLPDRDRRVLEQYVTMHSAETVHGGKLRFLTRDEFADRIFRAAYKGRCLVVGFNLPFDLSRVACDFTNARGRFAGGFALELWSYTDKAGCEHPDRHRPRVGIKQIDSKRALKGFTARYSPDREHLIPEDSPTGGPEEGYKFRGNFLDLRTLTFALTDRGYSLEAACGAFGVEHGKQHPARHGEVSEEYVDYNRRDVLATSELVAKLLEEYSKHPIQLQATKAYSPASLGKGYLRAMGITPILVRQPDFPKAYFGYAETAFFGGRTSANIRKTPVPVVYTDFLSMYPTVNSLMDLWRFVTAREIRVVEHCQGDIQAFLHRLTVNDLFNPATWQGFAAFVQVVPDDDILPSRAEYSAESNDWQVAVNHVSAESNNSQQALWLSLPDVIVSVILTGRIPHIVDAFRIEPLGKADGLKPIKLRGEIHIDPRRQDFFRVAIEERKRLSSRRDLPDSEKARLDKALKVLANATSYGIYAEMNRQESDKAVDVVCRAVDAEPFTCHVAHPDVPGEYCFPPLASLITGGARLMLALLEHSVRKLGGTYAMEDTDSMAIVATKRGGLVPCHGGPDRMPDGRDAVRALSWTQVDRIVECFAALNPYDRSAVPGSILKIEADNFDPKTSTQRELYCFAISAKRYALFLKQRSGDPVLLRKGLNNSDDRWSEHGLGHLLNPSDPESEDREWIAQVWLNMIRRALDLPAEPLGFERLPAVGRVTVSSPVVLRPFAKLNEGRRHADKIKPFNFLLTCHVKQFGHPTGADPERFHLFAPYESDPRKWIKRDWTDQYTGNLYRITTDGNHGMRNAARVRTYGDVIREYEFHPESKCADMGGDACDKQTIGLLQRRHIRIDHLKYIGKESNSLEEVHAGMIHDAQSVYTEYTDPQRDEWQVRHLPLLKRTPLSRLAKETGLSRRALMDWRAGRSRPHPKHQELIANILRGLSE
jgi:hypothetical protein